MSDFLEKWSRLYAIAKINEAQIKANPMPHLQRMSKRVCQLREAIDEALYIMSGATAYDMAVSEFPEMPPNIVETSLMRQREAEKILRKALSEPPDE